MKHLAAVLLLLATPALAVQGKSQTPVTDLPPPPEPPAGYKATPPPPEPSAGQKGTPPSTSDEEGLEPEITITTHGTDRFEEYRYHGQLYMIKVIPKHGIPYYLIDEEGRGQFHRSDLQPEVKIPMWLIKRF